MTLLWRDPWLKPLYEIDMGIENCPFCKKKFAKVDFVSSCEFCDIGIMHDACADKHILKEHKKQLEKKINLQKEKRLHDYQ